MLVRYVQPLTDKQRALLEKTMQEDTVFRARSRAHSLLLSAAGTPIKAIAEASQVHRVTVSAWIKKWEQHGAQSLHDHPRSGRPPKLTPDEQELAKHYIKEAPRSLKQVVERLANKTEKRLSISSLKRLAKKARLRWKRVRKSLKRLRDPEAFAKCQRALEALQQQEDQGKIDLYYFDESGFALDPSIPYAWQEPKSVIELPAMKYGRINVLGFLNRNNDLHAYMLTFRASFREKMRFELSSWDEHNNHRNPRTRRQYTSHHCAPQEHARGRIIGQTLPAQWQLAGIESRRDDGRVVGLHPLRG